MKLLNQATRYLAFAILVLVSIWSVILYFVLMYEIKDSIDDGLDNYKLLILREADIDTTVVLQKEFDEGNYRIVQIDRAQALTVTDYYQDTLMYMPFEDEMEPVRILRTAFEQDGKFYSLEIIASMVEEDDLIRDMFWSVIILFALIVISLIFVNNIVLRQLWKPFYSILNQLKRFQLGASAPPGPMTLKSKEFSDLKDVTDNLIKRSIASYDQQKEFIGNAAHELQTPVSTAIAKMELLLEQENLPEHLSKELGDILSSLERMRHLNKALLLLSKIENNQFPEVDTFSVSELITSLIDEMDDLARFRLVDIKHVAHQPCILNANKQLIAILLSNLLKNALLHNQPHGTIKIETFDHQIIFINTGVGGPLNTDRLFQRFYKSSTHVQSTGLGLAIAQAICALYQFKLLYAYHGDNHRFTIVFK